MSCAGLQARLKVADKTGCFSGSTSAEEKGKKFRFDNGMGFNVCRVKVDDCLITNAEIKKCDYFFDVAEGQKYYLVELKDTDVETATEQIIQTYEILNAKLKAEPDKFTGIIVSSSVPTATEQRFRRLQEKALRDKKLRIKKTHNLHIEKI